MTNRSTSARLNAATASTSTSTSKLRSIGRLGLGTFLVIAGTGHLTFARRAFRAQVPDWLPFDEDLVVLGSGLVEIVLGATAIAAPPARRHTIGWVLAAFFVAVLPGNISQYVTRASAFGLDSDVARGARLLFQPVLVVWALWTTGVIRRHRRRH